MPQGLLQVNRFVTHQNLMCTVSGATNHAKSNFRNILPVTLTHSRFCEEKFYASQWNQDFRDTDGEGVYQPSVVQPSVMRMEASIHRQLTLRMPYWCREQAEDASASLGMTPLVGAGGFRRGKRTAGSSPLGCARGRNDTREGEGAGSWKLAAGG
jgi:hypothetical protein